MGEFDTLNYAEYSYSPKNEGKVRIRKVLMCILYVLFVGAYFLTCYITRVIPLFAVCPIFTWMLVFFTWRYVSYDYYFEFKSGTLEVGTIRGGTKRRKTSVLHTIHVKEAVYAARYGSVDELGTLDKLCDYSSSVKEENRIAIVYEKDGKRVGVVLDSTTKLAGFIASYCPYAKELRGQKFIA